MCTCPSSARTRLPVSSAVPASTIAGNGLLNHNLTIQEACAYESHTHHIPLFPLRAFVLVCTECLVNFLAHTATAVRPGIPVALNAPIFFFFLVCWPGIPQPGVGLTVSLLSVCNANGQAGGSVFRLRITSVHPGSAGYLDTAWPQGSG